MRRALRQHLPAFAHLFGIRPWEIEDLTPLEIETFIAAARDLTSKK